MNDITTIYQYKYLSVMIVQKHKCNHDSAVYHQDVTTDNPSQFAKIGNAKLVMQNWW